MTPLTVCCLLVRGEYPYTPDYVRRLLAMVKRHCHRPFRFFCFTDQPDQMPKGVEIVQTHRIDGCWALWTKLRLFGMLRGVTGRILYLDLDTLIVDTLDPIIDYPASFALPSDMFVEERAHRQTDRYGRRLHRKFNGSVMVWDGGTQTALWDNWTLPDAERLSTDQDWIAEQAPHAQGLPASWFPRASLVQPPWPDGTTVVLAKKPKGPEACEKWPWFEPLWGGWEAA